jgi:hypothetical protein
MTDLVIFVIEEENLFGSLEHLYAGSRENEWHATGPALIARRRITDSGERHLAVFFDDLRRLGLQDRVVEVADELAIVAGDAAPRQVLTEVGPEASGS